MRWILSLFLITMSFGTSFAGSPTLKEYLLRWQHVDTSSLSSQLLLSSPTPCPTILCLAADEDDKSCRKTVYSILSEFPAESQKFCAGFEVVLHRNRTTGHPLEKNFVCRSIVALAIKHEGRVSFDTGVFEFCEESRIKGTSSAGISGQGRLYNSKFQKICDAKQVSETGLEFRCIFGTLNGQFKSTRGSGRKTEIFASDGSTHILMLTRRKKSSLKTRFPEVFK